MPGVSTEPFAHAAARAVLPMSGCIYAVLVPSFAFDIADVVNLDEGYKGITLIGPPIDTSDGLAVGDTLLVPTNGGGRTPCKCLEFPLVNLGPERAGWVLVSVSGVALNEVLVGARATRQT